MPEAATIRYRISRWLAPCLALLVIAAAGYHTWKSTGTEPIPLACADIAAGCAWPDHSLRVQFEEPPSALKPTRLVIAYEKPQEALYVRFRMTGMEMGLNRYRLIARGHGLWDAEVMLPVCIQGRQDWQMIVETTEGSFAIPFSTE